jgi:hypothetical protein
VIVGVAQVVLNVADAEVEAARWEAAGYARSFAVADLPNHPAKTALQGAPRDALAMIHLTAPEPAPAVEVTAYAGAPPAGRAAYTWDGTAARATVTDVAASTAFWCDDLGFVDDGTGVLRSPGLLPSMRLDVTLVEDRDADPATVDADGCVLVTVLSTDASGDAERLGGEAWTETVAGRELHVAMVRGPGGEPVEILQVPTRRGT